MDYILQFPWGIMAPEFVILGTATLLSLIDLILPERSERKSIPYLGLLGIILAAYFVLQNTGEVNEIMNHMYRLDGFAGLFKLILLAGTGLVFILSLQTIDGKVTKYRGEYYYLLLTALLGGMMMASSADLITLFIGLEMLSISSYILVGIRKKHLQSNESAFKYVVNGGISTAVLLFGMSYVYGITGTTNLYEIAETMQSSAFAAGYGPIIYVAFFFIFVGLSFKIASAPFHMWAPDVYQGAPTPVTAFLSVVSKAAGFAILTRVFMTSFAWLTDMEESMPQMFLEEVSIYLAVIAAVTMIVGNVMALRQINVKRMFAFSSIAQAGYILVPLAVANPLMLDEMVFYLIVYLLMNLGAFAVILAVTTDRGTDELRAFAGLYHRSPLMAVAMTIFLISLAGIPITGGFFGKLYIFLGTLWAGNYWLAGIMVATSVISYYYYFGIIRQMYMRPGDTEARINVPVSLAIVLIIGLIGTIVTGFFPNTILDYIQTEFDSETMFQMFNR